MSETVELELDLPEYTAIDEAFSLPPGKDWVIAETHTPDGGVTTQLIVDRVVPVVVPDGYAGEFTVRLIATDRTQWAGLAGRVLTPLGRRP